MKDKATYRIRNGHPEFLVEGAWLPGVGGGSGEGDAAGETKAAAGTGEAGKGAAVTAPAGLDEGAVKRIVAASVQQALAQHVARVPKPDNAPTADALAQVLREKWGLEDVDDPMELVEAVKGTVEKLRDKSLSPAERRAMRAARDMQQRLATAETELARVREERQQSAALGRARAALANQPVVNLDHVIAAASHDGLLQIDEDNGELVVMKDGRETGEPLDRFFADYLKANPHFLKAPPTGGARIAPGQVGGGAPPSLKLDDKTLRTASGRRAAFNALIGGHPAADEILAGAPPAANEEAN